MIRCGIYLYRCGRNGFSQRAFMSSITVCVVVVVMMLVMVIVVSMVSVTFHF